MGSSLKHLLLVVCVMLIAIVPTQLDRFFVLENKSMFIIFVCTFTSKYSNEGNLTVLCELNGDVLEISPEC